MSDDKKTQGNQDPAELENLDKDFKEKTADEIRQTVIDDYEFDEEIDTDKIDKLVNRELESQKSLSTAIRQKQKKRELLEKAGLDPNTGEPVNKTEDKKPKSDPVKQTSSDDVKKTIKEILEDERLAELEISDDIKKEISTYAKMQGVSIKEAVKSDYIKFQIDQAAEAKKIDDASLTSKSGAKRQVRKNFDDIDEDTDLTDMTDKEFEAYKQFQLNKNQ